MVRALALGVAGMLAVATLSCGPVEAYEEQAPQARIQAATVVVEDRCAGVVAADSLHVVTAAHCVRPGDVQLELTFQNGDALTAEVLNVDRVGDVAILRLRDTAPVEGLEFEDALPIPGEPAYFAGRFDRGAELQEIQILRLASCPSLPGIPAALFTSLRGTPGDSGAPVVNQRLRVIGLVHGGARCSVAAPTHEVPDALRTMGASAAVAR